MTLITDGNYVREDSLPVASGYMNYKNDARSIVGEVKGPNLLDEMLTAVDANYDPDTNMTRVGFAYGVHLNKEDQEALAEVGADYDPYR